MTMTPPSSANTVALVVIAIGVITGVAIGVASRKHPKLVLILIVPRALVPTVVVAGVGHGGLVKRRTVL